MSRVTMIDYRLRWDNVAGKPGDKTFSVCAYSLRSAEDRKKLLEAAGLTNVEIVRTKVASHDVIEVL